MRRMHVGLRVENLDEDYGTSHLPNPTGASHLDADCCEEISSGPERE